jgi:hypothetical protein
MSNELEQIAIQKRNELILSNIYTLNSNQYSRTNTRALSDDETPIQGKGTGIFLDTANGGGSLDINGVPEEPGSGRIGNLAFNEFGEQNPYTTPDTSGNIGQVVI